VNTHTADTANIERDLAETRVRLGNHLEELTRRLSPGQLLDDGLAYLRNGQGAAFARNLGSDLRDNPLPVALTGIGLAWLAIASGVSRNTNGSRDVVPYDQAEAWRGTSDVAGRAHRAGEAVTRAAQETEDAFRARVAEARAGVLGLQQEAAETASAFANRVEQALATAQNTAREGLDRVRRSAEAVGDAAQRAGGGIADTFGENPLLLGALGLAAGTLLGAVLPRTSQEEALMEPATKWAAGAARDAADEAIARGTRAVDAAASAAYRAARE
jgi:hypothetical protein